METPKHGGTRRNSGRKIELIGEMTRKITITIDDITHRRLKVLGAGNVSRGVRVGAKNGYADYQRSSD